MRNLDKEFRVMRIKQILAIIAVVLCIIGFIVFDFNNKRMKDLSSIGLNKISECDLMSHHNKTYLIAYLN